MQLDEYASYYVSLVDGSAGYLKQIRWCLVDFERVVGPVQIHELSIDLINRYLRDCKTRLAPRTRANRRGYLRTLLRHASTNQAISPRPTIDSVPLAFVKVPQTKVEAWTPEQVRCLLAVVDGLRGRYSCGFDKRLYWRSYVLSAWDLGLRGCDMRSLERSWIPPHGAFSVVQAKTGHIVYCRLREAALTAIAEFQHPGRLIWPRWCSEKTYGEIARRLVRLAGLPGSMGWLRASAATATEISQPGTGHLFLGHASRKTFLAHYYDQSQQISRPQPPPLGD